MVDLRLSEDDMVLRDPGVVKTLFDPACGTGGMLAVAEDRLRELNPQAHLAVYGQELNDESYAMCRSDMMLKGQSSESITSGNSFSRDAFPGRRFDYIPVLANPPFGVEWKKVRTAVADEAKQLGFAGRFGAGLPRIDDGSLLFLQHMISKMMPVAEGGIRLAIVFNGSPLFTGAAGSGEPEVRRSSTPTTPNGDPFTESGMNGFPRVGDRQPVQGRQGVRHRRVPGADPRREVPDRLRRPRAAHNVRRQELEGVNAVQTLARLNRTHPGKTSTFVLDFRDDADAVTEAFRPWYDTTIVDPVDANVLCTFPRAPRRARGCSRRRRSSTTGARSQASPPTTARGNGALFARKFMAVVLNRMDANGDIFKAILDDKTFAADLQSSYGTGVYAASTAEPDT